jgi:hypothetical protein
MRVNRLTAVTVLSVALVSGVAGARIAGGGTPAPTTVTIAPASDSTTAPAPTVTPTVPATTAVTVTPAQVDAPTAPRTVTAPTTTQTEVVTPKTTPRPDVEMAPRRTAPAPAPTPMTMTTPTTTAPKGTTAPEPPKPPAAECQDGMRMVGPEGNSIVTRTCVNGKWVETSRTAHEDPANGPDPRDGAPITGG